MTIRIYFPKHIELFRHLATEEYLLNYLKENEIILYLWQTNNAVVIGKNQNPWGECSITKLDQSQTQLGRRISGGGAVFQDRGNLNFSFILNKKNYDVSNQLSIIIHALREFGIEVFCSDRHALTLKGKKCSGNAFFFRKNKAIHHGTLLIDVNLAKMDQCLSPAVNIDKSNGVPSTRSEVINLTQISAHMTCEQVAHSIVRQFSRVFSIPPCKITSIPSLDSDEFRILYEKYSSWDWVYANSPKFQMRFKISINGLVLDFLVTIVHGRITEIGEGLEYFQVSEKELWRELLIGNRLEKKSLRKRLDLLLSKKTDTANLMYIQNWLDGLIL